MGSASPCFASVSFLAYERRTSLLPEINERMSVPPSPEDSLSLADRFVTLKGTAWKALLRHAEAFAYLVAGLPMALRRAFKGAYIANNGFTRELAIETSGAVCRQ